MKEFWKKADELVFIVLAIGPWTILVTIIIIVAIFKACFTSAPDYLNESINKAVEIVQHVTVLDSTDNGFRITYVTALPVTNEKYTEIKTRQSIKDGFERLKMEAPIHFEGNLLEADICDFALYVYRFHIDDDIMIHNIFVAGKDKKNFYVQPNPNLPGCATWMHHGTEQGNQYLNSNDINYYIPNGGRIYRYWKCRFLLQTSDTDERFSHFTEDERLY